MKILYISSYYKPAFVYGGPVSCVSQLCEAMSQLNAEITVFTTNANGKNLLDVPLNNGVNVDGVSVFYYPLVRVPPHNFFFSPKLAQACKKNIHKYDIVILQSFFSHGMRTAVNACKKAGIPYIIQLHGQLLPWSLKQKKLKKRLFLKTFGFGFLRNAAALHYTVQEEAIEGKKLGIKTPFFVVPNGINYSYYSNLPQRGYFRNKFDIPDNTKVLLFLGRLHPKKRPDLAIESLYAAQALSIETHLIIAGPDEMNMIPDLEKLANSLGISDKLHFTGLLEGSELLQIFSDSDLLLMPSEPKSENFGMSALEAMAAGLPIIVSEGVPIGLIAEKFGAGRAIPCSSIDFRNTTIELLSSNSLMEQMGKAGKELAKNEFEISLIAKNMLIQYKSIIDNGRPFLSDFV